MKNAEKSFQLRKEDYFVLADQVIGTIGSPVNRINSKLTKLLYSRIYHKEKVMFDEYFDMKRSEYSSLREVYTGERISLWEVISCEESGWCWTRYTGPRDEQEINYSEIFKWDCDLFVESYIMYVAVNMDNIQYEQLMGENASEAYLEYVIEDDIVSDSYARLVVCGAFYIDCKLHNTAMPCKYEELLCALYKEIYPLSATDAWCYYDSFFECLEEEMYEKECCKKLYPFLLDLFFAFKNDNEVTPELYFFTSKTMKEYRDVRESYLGSRFIPYLDKLLILLEDPMGTRLHKDSKELYQTDIMHMMNRRHYCALHEYTDTCFLGVYYSFSNHVGSKLSYNPFFKLARQLFDGMFQQMKEEEVNVI